MRISDWSSDVCSSDLPSRRWRLCPKNATAGARALGGGAGRFSLSLATWPIAGGTAHGAGRGEQAAKAAAGPLQASRRVAAEIGRASCRDRGGQYVSVAVVAGPLEQKKDYNKQE